MRIKKLELVGFKSFKDRTVIQFDAGITGIVGPNGCGKSNIVDALLWVMGEMSAKELRGSAMTDVIFAGAEGYAPLGMCEVSLTLENDGGPFPARYLKHSEIMLTRRLHRNGEGEYFINKEPARLKDVQEVFMDTGAGSKGFSIIQQGMIGKIITAKPEDRRHLIEEAAGITKFKARKKESQRKLQSTDQNLVRLQDIVGELKRQIDSLQRQAQRAERYRNLKNQVEDLDLWLSSRQFVDLRAAADEAQAIFNEAQSMEVEGEANLAQLQSDLETMRLQLLEKEKSAEVLQQNFYEKQSGAQKAEMAIQELRFEIEQARRNEVMTGNLLQEQQARLELLKRDQAQFQAQVEELRGESEGSSSLYAEKNQIFQSAQARISEVDEELTAKRRDLFAMGQSVSSLEARAQSMSSQVDDLRERAANEQAVLTELREKKHEFEERRNRVFKDLEKERQLHLDLASDVDSFEANRRVLGEAATQKRQEVDAFKDQLNEVTSLLYGLENLHNNFEGFEEGVKNVMLWQKTKWTEVSADGSVVEHFRPVSEVVEVPSDYEVAMEAALGSRLQMLLSTDSGKAVEAVSYLKDSKAGRSSFLTEGAGRGGLASVPAGEGVVALLKDVVRSSDKYRDSVDYLLDGVAVVDSIRAALALRPEHPGWTFVTADGDVLSADGVLTGGASEGAESGVLKRRREIKELTDKKNEWAGKLALAQASLRKTEEQLENVVNDFEGAQKRRIEQEIKVAGLKKDLERAEHELGNAQNAVERQEREARRLEEQANAQDERLTELNASLEENRLKKAELESEVERLNEELVSTRLGFEGLQNEVTELQVKSASKSSEYQGVQRQLDMVTRQVNELEGQLSRMSEESEQNSAKMTESQLALEERKIEFERLLDEVEQLRQQVALAKDEYERLAATVREMEESALNSQRARNERQSRMNEANLKLEQAKLKEQYLVDQIRERYMLLLPEIITKYEGREEDPVAAEAQLKELRERLGKIGEVNLSAIEEYEETAKRYEFLTQQHNDLTEAKEQLKRVIDRINRICSKRFKETFDLVNERFQRVFPVLFGGGEARLELHEDPEKQEMGIEIIAKPPGKKMQNVTLMSGGEKALTAVSLVFAIFLVKPSPYCLLDEVDAPLDDANVFRFNDLVREMAKRSQIICVTHNKHTMEVAGRLYGVTMQERGVSTMVSVNLADLR
ncbi:MAG: chromosome segregation protein SMC [Bdellovibrionaceae bacterium]|nr:chromosome segregation protein SMC [Pseudobdellovibrionaceae bacterium]